MAKDDLKDNFSSWDWQYYSEKRRQNEHELNELEIKPYFSLDQMIKAAFYCANKHLPKVDFSQPIKGNPGCGAAEYLHVCIQNVIKNVENK